MSFEQQIISKDKYPSIFSPQMEALIMLQIFLSTDAVLKIGEYVNKALGYNFQNKTIGLLRLGRINK